MNEHQRKHVDEFVNRESMALRFETRDQRLGNAKLNYGIDPGHQ
ncbi:hypothetical protein COLO4_29600 [Corchorus olitorius]|uniref:Uncharacterized protein n=1 Tax=Corchorus olitorius TaxID=93759 RepID=A0A1R3HE36_9ROSI|nr:hypothetical protein COLO4_29600 [Corchorus olitorius]